MLFIVIQYEKLGHSITFPGVSALVAFDSLKKRDHLHLYQGSQLMSLSN